MYRQRRDMPRAIPTYADKVSSGGAGDAKPASTGATARTSADRLATTSKKIPSPRRAGKKWKDSTYANKVPSGGDSIGDESTGGDLGGTKLTARSTSAAATKKTFAGGPGSERVTAPAPCALQKPPPPPMQPASPLSQPVRFGGGSAAPKQVPLAEIKPEQKGEGVANNRAPSTVVASGGSSDAGGASSRAAPRTSAQPRRNAGPVATIYNRAHADDSCVREGLKVSSELRGTSQKLATRCASGETIDKMPGDVGTVVHSFRATLQECQNDLDEANERAKESTDAGRELNEQVARQNNQINLERSQFNNLSSAFAHLNNLVKKDTESKFQAKNEYAVRLEMENEKLRVELEKMCIALAISSEQKGDDVGGEPVLSPRKVSGGVSYVDDGETTSSLQLDMKEGSTGMKLSAASEEEGDNTDAWEAALTAPLTPEQEASVDAALAHGQSHEVLASGTFALQGDLSLTRKDVATMTPGEWLNDEMVNFTVCSMAAREVRRRPSEAADGTTPQARTHFMNTRFVKNLCGEGDRSYDYDAVRRWTNLSKLGYDMLACDTIIIPVHQSPEGIHWVLATIELKNQRVRLYDSLHGEDHSLLVCLKRWVGDECENKKKETVDTSGWVAEHPKEILQQENGCDCGVFMLKYGDCIGSGCPLSFTQKDMEYFRRWIVADALASFAPSNDADEAVPMDVSVVAAPK